MLDAAVEGIGTEMQNVGVCLRCRKPVSQTALLCSQCGKPAKKPVSIDSLPSPLKSALKLESKPRRVAETSNIESTVLIFLAAILTALIMAYLEFAGR